MENVLIPALEKLEKFASERSFHPGGEVYSTQVVTGLSLHFLVTSCFR